MKEGWVLENIGDLCQIVNGGTPKTNVSSYWDGDINWITPADLGKLTTKLVGSTKRKITQIGLEKSSAKLFPPNSIILSTRAPIGHLAINTAPMCTNQGCRGLVPKNRLDVWYLFYFLWNNVDLLDSLGSGTTFKELSTKALSNVLIPTPPLPEQQRIVSIIDEAFEAIDKAIENTQKNLQNAKELFESYLQGVFQDKGDGWEVKTLGDVCEYDKTPYKRDDLPYVGLEDIQSNTGVFVGSFEPRKMKSLTFYFNDEHVLYGRLRPYLNKVLQPHFEGHCSTEIFPIKPKKNLLDRGFLFRWLIATETMKQINNTWTGATLPRANMNAVLEFSINLPSIIDQQAIVKKMEYLSTETKKIESKYQQKLRDLEELKKSILNKAFAGEL
jgi:type I restriction enzyme S subunit